MREHGVALTLNAADDAEFQSVLCATGGQGFTKLLIERQADVGGNLAQPPQAILLAFFSRFGSAGRRDVGSEYNDAVPAAIGVKDGVSGNCKQVCFASGRVGDGFFRFKAAPLRPGCFVIAVAGFQRCSKVGEFASQFAVGLALPARIGEAKQRECGAIQLSPVASPILDKNSLRQHFDQCAEVGVSFNDISSGGKDHQRDPS